MNSKVKILSIDTSNKSSSVSILENDNIIGEIFLNCGLVHSKTIYNTIKYLLNLSSFSLNEIDLLSVCTGPGSYTGIRIGTSLVKGLSISLNKPCIGISSLTALANSVDIFDHNYVIYSCLKANSEEIYFSAYDFYENNSEVKSRFKDSFISFKKLSEIIKDEKKRIIFVGNASKVCYNIFSKTFPNLTFKLVDIYSSVVGKVAFKYFDNSGNFDALNLIPNYLKDVKIERKKNE